MDKRMTYGGNGSHWDGCAEVHWDCKIAQLEAELAALREQTRWIPVSERLPEKFQRCIVLDKNKLVHNWMHDDALLPLFAEYTHWMPLPEPPEVE